MVIDGTDPFATAKPNARLVKLLLRARRFNAALTQGEAIAFAALAQREGVSRSYFTRLVRLSYLAPDIIQAILDGRQPRDLTPEKLLAHSRLPIFADVQIIRSQASNSMLRAGPTTPQDYPERSGFGRRREREWGHGGTAAWSVRSTHPCAFTLSATTELHCAARRLRRSVTARLPSDRMRSCMLPHSAPSGC